MKHYIITYEEHIWLVYAKNPADAIKKVMSNGFKGKWNDFIVKSVGSITREIGEVVEFQVRDAE